MGNPNNSRHVSSARQLNTDWKEFRDMYERLHSEVRQELDN